MSRGPPQPLGREARSWMERPPGKAAEKPPLLGPPAPNPVPLVPLLSGGWSARQAVGGRDRLASPASIGVPPLPPSVPISCSEAWTCLKVPDSWRNQMKSVLMAQSQGQRGALLTICPSRPLKTGFRITWYCLDWTAGRWGRGSPNRKAVPK